MKRRQRKLVGLLLACMLTCLPTAQAFAETSFDASAGVSGQILFEKDSVVNAAGAVMLDGAEVAPAGGSWTNTDEDKVYKASSAEDGTIVLTQAGYMLVVQDGTASYTDEEKSDEQNHYKFLDWEKPQEGDPVKDIACYPAGESITLIANAPKEGMAFSHWSTDTEGVEIADPYNVETTITMPEKKVQIQANYELVSAEGQTEAPVSGEEGAPQPEGGQTDAPVSYQVTVNNGDGSGSYYAGDWVSVAAYDRSDEGLVFDGWYVDSLNAVLDNTASEFTGFVMPEAAVTLTAAYRAEQTDPVSYTVTVNNGTGAGSYEESTLVTVTANDRSSENLIFTGWTVDSMNVTLSDTSAAEASFSMPAEAVTLTANYEEKQSETTPTSYEVTVNNGNGSGTYSEGETVTVTALDYSDEGGEFSGWYVESLNAALSDTSAEMTSFVMPKESVVITATYTGVELETDLITDEPESADESELITDEPGIVDDESEDESDTEAADEVIVDEPESDDEESTEQAGETLPGNDLTVIETESETNNTAQDPTEAESESEEQSEEEELYTLTVENGHGSGSYAVMTSVKAEADVPEGYRFVQWTTESTAIVISDSTASMIEFLMPEENVTLTAQYEKVYTVSLPADGLVIFESLEGTSASFIAGETVSVSAELENDAGQVLERFEAYGKDGKKVDLTFKEGEFQGTVSFTMPAQDITVKAVYAEKPVNYYTVKVSNGLINGTATEVYVPEWTKIEVKANPGPTGQYFVGWVINGGTFDMGDAASEETIWLDVTQDMTILATYEGYQYSVTVNSGKSDYTNATAGTVVTIEANAAPEGMQFDSWYVDSANVALTDASKAKTTFTMPEGDVVISAKYKQIEFSVSVENGTSDKQYYHAGDVVTVSSSYPASGRVFDKWVAVSGNVTFGDASRWQTTFKMPAANVTLKATYKDGPSAADNMIQEIVSGGQYLIDSTIRFTAVGAGMDNTNPNPGDYRYRPSGYQIGNVTGTWQAAPYSTSMSIKTAGEYTLKVVYNKDVYDGSKWVSEGSSDAKSITFHVVTEAEGVATGDSTPIAAVIAAAAVSCLLFVILLVVFIRRKSHRR